MLDGIVCFAYYFCRAILVDINVNDIGRRIYDVEGLAYVMSYSFDPYLSSLMSFLMSYFMYNVGFQILEIPMRF